jgi:predicted transcriptional regulator
VAGYEKDTVMLDEMYVMLTIPEDAVSLKVTAQIIVNGDLKKAEKSLSTREVFQARKDFLDYIGDDFDAMYVLTDEGRKYYEMLKSKKDGNV